jgi:hypothetical protein
MNSLDKRKIVATSILFGALVIYFDDRMLVEVIFPGQAAYFILTFYLSYPDSYNIRHFIVTLMLSFGNIIFIKLLRQSYNVAKDNENIKILFLEFFVLFLGLKMMSKKKIYTEFSDSVLRTVVFLTGGYFKAFTIIETFKVMLSDLDPISQEVFIKALLVSGVQSTIPGVVYLIDTFFCLDIPVRQISFNGIISLWKIGFFIGAIGMIAAVIWEKRLEFGCFVAYPCQNLLIYLCFLFIYGVESFNYGRNFKPKPN